MTQTNKIQTKQKHQKNKKYNDKAGNLNGNQPNSASKSLSDEHPTHLVEHHLDPSSDIFSYNAFKGFQNKILKLFQIKKKNFIKRISHKIDDETEPFYLKTIVNHKKEVQCYSACDVLEIHVTRHEKMIEMQKKSRRRSTILKFNLKKTNNYFLEFVTYLQKKKNINLKPMQHFKYYRNYSTKKAQGKNLSTFLSKKCTFFSLKTINCY